MAGNILGDTWLYDPRANLWHPLEPTGAGPGTRMYHSATAVGAGKRTESIVTFGGFDGTEQCNSVHVLDICHWTPPGTYLVYLHALTQ